MPFPVFFFFQDKSADFSFANSVGVRNNIFAILVLGTYEVLIEYSYITGKMRYDPLEKFCKIG